MPMISEIEVKNCRIRSNVWRNVSTICFIVLKKNRSGQSLQIGKTCFTAFFRFLELPRPYLRCIRNGTSVGLRYSMRFGAVLSVRLLLFGLDFK